MLFVLCSPRLDLLRIWTSLLLGSSCIGLMSTPRNILFVGDGMFFRPFCSPLVFVLFGRPWLFFFFYQYVTFYGLKKNPSL